MVINHEEQAKSDVVNRLSTARPAPIFEKEDSVTDFDGDFRKLETIEEPAERP